MLFTTVSKAFRPIIRPCIIISARPVHTDSESKSCHTPNPKKITTDMIGPPDPVSNLRQIIFKEPSNETDLEKTYRKLRADVVKWNHTFWTNHNSRFFQERQEYLKKHLPDGKENLTADEMSVFYKAFLDKNWKSHIAYNKEWYKKNITLLGLALKIKITKLFRIKKSK